MFPTHMKVVTINIEGTKHFDRWIPFVQQEDPDVLCLQEVYAVDLDRISTDIGMRYTFVPTLLINDFFEDVERHDVRDWGIAVFYKKLPRQVHAEYYTKDATKPGSLPLWNGRVGDIWKQAVIVARFEGGISVACTHFAWTKEGVATDYQRSYMRDLLHVLHRHQPIVFCGDLNAPRGRATWEMVEDHYEDNIPADTFSTLDPVLHKVPGLPYIVDGFFTSSELEVTDVRVVDGVSDHRAVVGEVLRP